MQEGCLKICGYGEWTKNETLVIIVLTRNAIATSSAYIKKEHNQSLANNFKSLQENHVALLGSHFVTSLNVFFCGIWLNRLLISFCYEWLKDIEWKLQFREEEICTFLSIAYDMSNDDLHLSLSLQNVPSVKDVCLSISLSVCRNNSCLFAWSYYHFSMKQNP